MSCQKSPGIVSPVLVDSNWHQVSVCFEGRDFTIMDDLWGVDFGLSNWVPLDAVCWNGQEQAKKGPQEQEAIRWEHRVWPWPWMSAFSLPAVIPKVTKHLLSNPVFTCIILAACMEIAVVAGFAAFLGKYLEQQFNLTTSSANQLLGECVFRPPERVGGGCPVFTALRIYWALLKNPTLLWAYSNKIYVASVHKEFKVYSQSKICLPGAIAKSTW